MLLLRDNMHNIMSVATISAFAETTFKSFVLVALLGKLQVRDRLGVNRSEENDSIHRE